MSTKNIALIGANGAVGQTMLRLLQERAFPFQSIRFFGSSRDAGKSIQFNQQIANFERLKEGAFHGIDLAFFCAGDDISREWIPLTNCLAIDLSTAFRETAPLIIPEINFHAIQNHNGVIASPNCVVTILAMPLFPLHRMYQVKRIVLSTYQAASGGGNHLLKELKNETRAFLEEIPYDHHLSFPYAFNLYPHDSPLDPYGYVEEENKILSETRKIFEDPSIQLSATCVRVPVLTAHAISVNVEFHNPFSIEEIHEAWERFPGIAVFEDRLRNRFPTPYDAAGGNNVLCGRLRVDRSQPNTVEFWVVGDQLRKGSALNAIQIAEYLST